MAKTKKAGQYMDLTGHKYGRLTVIRFIEVNVHRKPTWECKCECGAMLIVSANALRKGNTKSCGCLKNQMIGERRRTHGMSKSPEYLNWLAMRSRCNNRKNQDYKLYGGRGIKVCERWSGSFENFLTDMGRRPAPRMTVERMNTCGNYEPGNCRWATQKQQTRNKRNNKRLAHNGITLTLAEWAELLGLNYGTIQHRLTMGWSVKDALTLARQHRWSRRKKGK